MVRVIAALSNLTRAAALGGLVFALGLVGCGEAPSSDSAPAHAGSKSCRSCHERFYELWSTSFHGLAMQAYTPEFAKGTLTLQEPAVEIGGRSYRAVVGTGADHVEEDGPEGRRRHPIVQVLGGKNVYYFLTPLERGRLQVLPVAYDVRRKEWFETAKSAVRHFVGVADEELDWTDRAYTFNTSCHACHVSQFRSHYDPATDAYRSDWAEPGVNCETCHGPAGEHVRVCQGLEPGEKPADLEIVSVRSLTKEQRNDLCASCHAKVRPLGTSFAPGDRFFDHFDLVTIDSPDYHPDGRDLGENYTFTSWRLSPCVASGTLDCLHCHSSSGRFRFAERPDEACLPCHEERVRNATAHSRHPVGSAGSHCVHCHMPTTEFARMRRSDHSMRPPSPAASIALGSPNACTGCHGEEGSAWARKTIEDWHGKDAGERILMEGRLVAAARAGKWSLLPEMLRYLAGDEGHEIVQASLIRLMQAHDDAARWPVLRGLAAAPSPLVRAAAMTALGRDPGSRAILLAGTRDEFRLVRIRSVAALGHLDVQTLEDGERDGYESARVEFEQSLLARPDDPDAHYDLGNHHLEWGDPAAAAMRFQKALALRPEHVPSLVNLSMAEARRGRLGEAEEALRRALHFDSRSAAAHFNLGLLLAETDRPKEARKALSTALRLDPANARAAYNLAVLLGPADPAEAAALAASAAKNAPDVPVYAWAQACFLERAGDAQGALAVVERLATAHPGHRDAWSLWGAVLERQGKYDEACDVYRRAAATPSLPDVDRARFEERSRALRPR